MKNSQSTSNEQTIFLFIRRYDMKMTKKKFACFPPQFFYHDFQHQTIAIYASNPMYDLKCSGKFWSLSRVKEWMMKWR